MLVDCFQEKITKIRRSSYKAKLVLDVSHMTICGPLFLFRFGMYKLVCFNNLTHIIVFGNNGLKAFKTDYKINMAPKESFLKPMSPSKSHFIYILFLAEFLMFCRQLFAKFT